MQKIWKGALHFWHTLGKKEGQRDELKEKYPVGLVPDTSVFMWDGELRT